MTKELETLSREELIDTILELCDTLDYERAQFQYYIRYLVSKYTQQRTVTERRVLH